MFTVKTNNVAEDAKKEVQELKNNLSLERLNVAVKIKDYVADMAKMEIISGGARSGQPYRELSPETTIAKGNDRFLVDSGQLLRDVANLKLGVQGNKEVITLDNEYAKFLQDGTKNMPKRKIFNFTPEDEKNLGQIIENAVDESTKANG